MERAPAINLTDLRSHEWLEDHFRVKSIKNNIRYQVGQCLTSADVVSLIAEGWTVNVVDKD